MAAQLLENIAYFDEAGLPLVGGKVYIGINGLEPVGNPLSIFSDRDLTISLTNPQTLGSDGIAANKIWIPGIYSLRVENVLGVQHTLDLDLGSAAVSEFLELISVSGANAITASTSDVIASYVDKQIFVFNAAGTNTSTGVTLDVDTVGAKSIFKNFDQALDPGDITANQSLIVIYNSTSDNFQWINANVKTKRQTKGTDIASASSITVPDNDGNYFDITGSTGPIATINGIVGTFYTFQMDSTPTFTNSASLVMRGAADFTAAAGDVLEFYQLTSSTVINTNIAKADGTTIAFTSPLTTKGDLYTFDTSDVRFPVGSNDQVLIADSAETTGLKWGSVSISQGDLNTTTGEVSFISSSTVRATSLVTLPGGQYGFFPQIKHVVVSASTGGWTGPDDAVVSSTFATVILLTIDGNGNSSSKTTTGVQRFVQASPPYDLGDGDVHSFLFARIQKVTGLIINLYLSPDPPWANNGPTNIAPNFIYKNGKRYRSIGRFKKGASLEDDNPFETQSIEITNSFKNSDMDLIPHPFQGNDLSNDIIVLIDPMSKIVENLERMKNFGDSALDLFHNGYIRIDNTELQRGAPKGVIVCSAKMTNKLRI